MIHFQCIAIELFFKGAIFIGEEDIDCDFHLARDLVWGGSVTLNIIWIAVDRKVAAFHWEDGRDGYTEGYRAS